jgi:acetylornithine deacetylase/succinyl-diaminopimelate desuccinylase-like protein
MYATTKHEPTTPPTLDNMPENLHKLLSMLQFKRPAGSKSEAAFINRYIMPAGARRDAFGNYWRTVGHGSKVLWSSHFDTVHKTPGMQKLFYGDGYVNTDKECLGADCGVGVWLMLEMIQARVPGTYIFHAQEEAGGKGSAYIAANYAERLRAHNFAIAFDRMGYNEIITHQIVGRTASDAFATSLAGILQKANPSLTYAASDKGSFTDTANYASIIPECSNIGVGYHLQHQKNEYLDICHAAALREGLCAADWSGLVSARDPAVAEPRAYSYDGYGWKNGKWERTQAGKTNESLFTYVSRAPYSVSRYLQLHGITKKEIEEAIAEDDKAWSASGSTEARF